MKMLHSLLTLLLIFATHGLVRAQTITFDVTVTADNQYGLYTGTQTQALNYAGGEYAILASDIWTPESYTMTLPEDQFIYVTSWSDHNTYQGLMAQFDNGSGLILSGDPQWQVTATGITRDNGAPPVSITDLSNQIVLANAGSNASGGWGAAYAGFYNDPSSLWGTAIGGGMASSARWMWYDSGMDPSANAPFVGFNHDEYLIFRIPIKARPGDPDNPRVPEPATSILFVLGSLGLLSRRCGSARRR